MTTSTVRGLFAAQGSTLLVITTPGSGLETIPPLLAEGPASPGPLHHHATIGSRERPRTRSGTRSDDEDSRVRQTTKLVIGPSMNEPYNRPDDHHPVPDSSPTRPCRLDSYNCPSGQTRVVEIPQGLPCCATHSSFEPLQPITIRARRLWWAVVDRMTEAFFRGLGRFRTARGFHPEGVSFSAHIIPCGEAESPWARFILGSTSEHRAQVRLSKGAGLPDPLPDVLGLAVKVEGEGPSKPVDLLLSSAPSWPVARQLLRPARYFGGVSFSSVLPFECEGVKIVLGAVPANRVARYTLDELRETEAPELSYLLTGAPLRSAWRPFARLDISRRLEPAASKRLTFNPYNVPAGLRPAGWINRLRMPAYPASQRGRHGE
jgi:hypothetical protein